MSAAIKETLTKRCSTCYEMKPRSAFNRSKDKRDGLQCQCKDCHAETAARSYRLRKEFSRAVLFGVSPQQAKARRLAALPMWPCVCGCEVHRGACSCGCPSYFEKT